MGEFCSDSSTTTKVSMENAIKRHSYGCEESLTKVRASLSQTFISEPDEDSKHDFNPKVPEFQSYRWFPIPSSGCETLAPSDEGNQPKTSSVYSVVDLPLFHHSFSTHTTQSHKVPISSTRLYLRGKKKSISPEPKPNHDPAAGIFKVSPTSQEIEYEEVQPAVASSTAAVDWPNTNNLFPPLLHVEEQQLNENADATWLLTEDMTPFVKLDDEEEDQRSPPTRRLLTTSGRNAPQNPHLPRNPTFPAVLYPFNPASQRSVPPVKHYPLAYGADRHRAGRQLAKNYRSDGIFAAPRPPTLFSFNVLGNNPTPQLRRKNSSKRDRRMGIENMRKAAKIEEIKYNLDSLELLRLRLVLQLDNVNVQQNELLRQKAEAEEELRLHSSIPFEMRRRRERGED